MTRFVPRLALVTMFILGGAAGAWAVGGGPGGQGGPGGMRPGGQGGQGGPGGMRPGGPRGLSGPAKPPGHRSAKFGGGRGETWKSGKDDHGFMGSYGGCRYKGFAGPNGYRLDKSC